MQVYYLRWHQTYAAENLIKFFFKSLFVSAASSLIRGMLTVKAEERANIIDICSHWWINDGYTRNCLEEAEYLASLTPVRLDLLLSLTRQEKREPPDEAKSEVCTVYSAYTVHYVHCTVYTVQCVHCTVCAL